MEQRHWQRPKDNNKYRTLDQTGDHADTNFIGGDMIHLDEERPDLKDLE